MVKSVGIDVGKSSCQVALRDNSGEYIERSFSNSDEGLAKCVEFLNTRGVSKETPLVLESTGGYHLLFTMTLRDTYHYGSVKVINGILTKKYLGANIRKIKSDSVDAKILADIGEREKLMNFDKSKEWLIQKKKISMLKKLEHIRQQLRASTNDLEETSNKLGFSVEVESRSKKILEAIEQEIQSLLDEISDGAEGELRDELVKIPGISCSAISIVLSMIGDRQFTVRDQLVAFCGIDLTVRESGTSIHGKRHLSKRGDPFLRKKLFQIAWALKMHNPEYKRYYEKKREEGHHYFTCLIAVARKFLRQIHGTQRILEHNKPIHANKNI